jgi:hypothetical protein
MLAARQPAGLSDEQRAERRRMIAFLREYIDAGRFPINDVRPQRTSIFVDAAGNRCAMAALIERTGQGALVARIARTNNLARVHALAGDVELARWLTAHGLTVDEASRVQPGYDNRTTSRWAPTFAVLATGSTGASLGSGFELAGGPALRVGARRITETTGACDDCVFRTFALVLEYARLFQLSRPGTNQLSLLGTWDLLQQSRDSTVYALGGVVGSLDESAPLQLGLGGTGGVGFGWRSGVPWFVEGLVQAAWQTRGLGLRLAANLGFAW